MTNSIQLLKSLCLVAGLGLLAACQQPCPEVDKDDVAVIPSEPASPARALAKFEPQDGQVILFVGQELESIGGLEAYNDGYLDHFEKPGGFTMYTNMEPGMESFGMTKKGLDGVYTTDDWGDSPSNMSMQLADSSFDDMALAIGLEIIGVEDSIADGHMDAMVERFGNFLDSIDRPVFLRIGYEFDGHLWNHYDREGHKRAFRYMKDKYDAMGIDNIAYVWQSTGWVSSMYHLEDWYPGDEYVDWCSYSFFSRWDEANMINFARQHGKPVFIAEATPTISSETCKFDGVTQETILSNQAQAEEAWEKWFVPFFNTIDDNPDVVKAVSYINCNWLAHEMWKENPTFKRIDARLQTNEWISSKWNEQVSKPKYLKAPLAL